MWEQIKEWWRIPVVQRTVVSLLVILGALLLYVIIRKIHKAYRKRRGTDDREQRVSSVRAVIYDTIKVSIFAILILTILQINGVNVTSLVAGLGVASAVIGLALQDFLKDIIMGIHIMMDDFYQIGDLVQFGEDEEGIIEDFNLRTTKIRSIKDSDLITVCNRNIDRIVKSGTEVYIHQPMPYDVPSERAEEVMSRIAEQASEIDGIVAGTFLGLNAFNSSSIDYLLKIEIEKPELKLRTRRDVLAMIRRVYEAEGITVPYEQLDVHMKTPAKM